MFEETVIKFNENKFFKDLEDFVIKRSSDFVGFEEVEQFESLQYDERDDFIATHKN